MKHLIPEISIVILMIVFAALLANPYWMPMGAIFVLLGIFVVLVGGFATFVWREQGGDERDMLIRHVASRFAYLAVTMVLAIGIVYKTLVHHEVDAWLLGSFVIVVLAKAIGNGYGKIKY